MVFEVLLGTPLLLASGVFLLVGLGAAGLMATVSTDDAGLPPDAQIEETRDPDEVSLLELPEPELQTARWGWPQKLYRMHRQHKKRRKLANRGYVQWYLIDDTYPTPKFVKPETKGGGIPEYEYDEERYLFPKDAMVASEQQGLWTIVHKKGEADPVNLRDPTEYAVPADTLENYLDMRVNTEPPSWLDQFDLEPAEIFKWLLLGLVAFMMLRSVLGGGLL